MQEEATPATSSSSTNGSQQIDCTNCNVSPNIFICIPMWEYVFSTHGCFNRLYLDCSLSPPHFSLISFPPFSPFPSPSLISRPSFTFRRLSGLFKRKHIKLSFSVCLCVCLCLYHLSQWLPVLPNQRQNSILCCIILLHCEYVNISFLPLSSVGWQEHITCLWWTISQKSWVCRWTNYIFSVYMWNVGRILGSVHAVFRRVILPYLPTDSIVGLFSSQPQ